MKNVKIIKALAIALAVVMFMSSVPSKAVLAKEYSINGYWVKGDIAISIDSDSMTIGVYRKGGRHGECYGEYKPFDTNKNKYSVVIYDKLQIDEFGYATMKIKKNKMKFKWEGGNKNYKYLKGTFKHKNWGDYLPQSWAYKE